MTEQPLTIDEIWEKWRHLDHLLSDRDWIGDNPRQEILYDLWQAVKWKITRKEGRGEGT